MVTSQAQMSNYSMSVIFQLAYDAWVTSSKTALKDLKKDKKKRKKEEKKRAKRELQRQQGERAPCGVYCVQQRLIPLPSQS